MILEEVKKRITIVSRDKARADKIKESLMLPDDCFGKNYSETADPCKICNVICELDGARDSMQGFCRKFTLETTGVEESETEPGPEQKESTLEEQPEVFQVKNNVPVYHKGTGSGSGSKTNLKLRGKGGIEKMVVERIASGVPGDEIKQEIQKMYLEAGRDLAFAKRKSSFWLSWGKWKIRQQTATEAENET